MSRIMTVALSLALAGLPLGCKDDEPKAYPTYQECFDELTFTNMETVEDAIVACCLEHPINGAKLACGASKPDCINYLTDNLKQTSAGVDQVMNACQVYIDMKPSSM